MLLSGTIELSYIQIVIYHYFTSGHDPYDVLWVVRLVLEDMGEVKILVVKLCWVIFNGFSLEYA
jgi:hypothetical protein